MRFESWYFLLLIPVVISLMFYQKHQHSIKYSNVQMLKKSGMGKTIKHKIGDVLITIALCSFVIALARPQVPNAIMPIQGQGIDIVTVLDVSGSMQSVDFEPNRLEVARETIQNFISARYEDRIGLVIFAGTAYTRIPLTLDHEVVQQSLSEVNTDSVSEEGTAIGMAISVGVNRLKKSEAASKVMILVTDGDNNAGAINPETASLLASELDIKIYTIGVGSDQTIMPYSYFGRTQYKTVESSLDEALLQGIADTTGGQYFRADEARALEGIFDEINQLEQTDFDRDKFQLYDEWAFLFIRMGLVFLLLGFFFKRYYFVQVP